MAVQVDESAVSLTVFIVFQKAESGAEGSAPGPGQCAWIDRPVSTGEPSRLFYRTRGEHLRNVSFRGTSYSYLRTSNNATSNWLRAVLTGQSFTVYAYNDGRGALVVSSVPQ